MWDMIGNIVGGGWNAINNLTSGLGGLIGGASKAASGLISDASKAVSGLTSQLKTSLSSSIMQPTIFDNKNYRVTDPDAPSIQETADWAYDNWFNSPYENQYAVHTVESNPWSDPWKSATDALWKSATGAISAINQQLPNLLMQKLGLAPKPQTQNSQGAVVYQVPPATNTNNAPTTTPSNFFEQMAGLFGLGYPSPTPTPAVPIQQPTVIQQAGLSTNMIIGLAAAAIVVVLLSRKK